MTLQEFVDKRNGTAIEFANGYGKQCYNLMCVYFWDMGWSPTNTYPYCPSGGVKDCIERYDEIPMLRENGIKAIYNNSDPNHLPQVGDVIIYNWFTFGHVEICLEVSQTGMKTIGQNVGNGDGIGDDDNVRIINNRSYNGVIGWLRKEQSSSQPIQSIQQDTTLIQLDNINYFYPERKQAIKNGYYDNNKVYLIGELAGAGKTVDQKDEEIKSIRAEFEKYKQQIPSVSTLPEKQSEEIKKNNSESNNMSNVSDEVKDTSNKANNSIIIEKASNNTNFFESKTVQIFITSIMSAAALAYTAFMTTKDVNAALTVFITTLVTGGTASVTSAAKDTFKK